jgi:D-alanyl-D-alanine carboxypeptidase (penicillin-binding protein 5/6)
MKNWFVYPLALALLAAGTGATPATTRKTVAKPAAAKPAAVAAPKTIHGIPVIFRDPYLGAIAVDGATGKVLVEDNADATVFPASCIKLMNLFVVLDRVQQGTVRLADPVKISPEICKIGGSQVYLDPKESFTVEDLVYALMVQSANDAAAALAIHTAGSQEAFVQLMNQKAQALGLTRTHFFSCHGLPPTAPRKPEEVDVSTPRELSQLARALVEAHPEVLTYTSTLERTFRTTPKPFIMRNHNHRLLDANAGVDGLKTGYFDSAGYSSIVTAKRNDRRVFVVVAGSGRADKKDLGVARDKAALEILNRAFAALPPAPPPPPPRPALTNAAPTNAAAALPARDPTTYTPAPDPAPRTGASNWRTVGIVLGAVVLGAVGVAGFFAWRRRQEDDLGLGGRPGASRRPLPPLQR